MTAGSRAPEAALADYVLGLRLEDVPAEVRAYARMILLDCIGIAAGASARDMPSARIAAAWSRDNGAGPAALWSGGGRVSAETAAFVNATQAEVLDFQDVVVDGRNNGHVAVAMIPALIAVAEHAGASGAEALAALIAGIETQLAILRALGRRHREDGRGFRTTTISAPLSAALACARVLGLDREAALNALGLAAVLHPAGLLVSLAPENDAFGMDKDFANGQAAAVAVKASLLAARGVAASGQAVSGVSGLIESYAFGDGRPLVPPVPGRFETCRVALKRYPACYGCHAAIEAALALRAEDGLADPAAFQSVRVRVKKAAAETLNVSLNSRTVCICDRLPGSRCPRVSQRLGYGRQGLYHEFQAWLSAASGLTPRGACPSGARRSRYEARRQAIADAVAGIEALQDVRALGDLFLERGRGIEGSDRAWCGRGPALSALRARVGGFARYGAGSAALPVQGLRQDLQRAERYAAVGLVDPRNNGHAAVTIVPAAVAVAESVGAPGRDLVSAVAAGIEVTIAIVRAVGRAHRAEVRGDHQHRRAWVRPWPGKLLGHRFLAAARSDSEVRLWLAPATGADAVVTGENGLVASHAHGTRGRWWCRRAARRTSDSSLSRSSPPVTASTPRWRPPPGFAPTTGVVSHIS